MGGPGAGRGTSNTANRVGGQPPSPSPVGDRGRGGDVSKSKHPNPHPVEGGCMDIDMDPFQLLNNSSHNNNSHNNNSNNNVRMRPSSHSENNSSSRSSSSNGDSSRDSGVSNIGGSNSSSWWGWFSRSGSGSGSGMLGTSPARSRPMSEYELVQACTDSLTLEEGASLDDEERDVNGMGGDEEEHVVVFKSPSIMHRRS